MTTQPDSISRKEINRLMLRWALVLAALGALATWAVISMSLSAARLADSPGQSAATPVGPTIEYWTCTMHPEVEMAEPGACPICGMDLVAKYAGSDQLGEPPRGAHQHAAQPAAAKEEPQEWYRCTMPECGDVGSADPESRCPVCGMKRESVGTASADDDEDKYRVTLSERARRLAQVATASAEERLLYKRVRTVGRIEYDETRHKTVAAWTGGRIDKLYADFTGMVVQEGDHLVQIYSPELLSAQEEYLQALRAAKNLPENALSASRRSTEQLARSARRKLELLGIREQQIETIKTFETPQTHLTIHAPIGGTVVSKRAMEGMYVKTGDTLYEIADLTRVWLLLDVYESDLPWVQPFQDVLITTKALPGAKFYGKIAFVDPVVDKQTRTVAVRVNVTNPKRRLKPEMYVNAEIVVPLARDGRPVAPAPDGDFACPMHPWETALVRVDCPICGMDMVSVAELPGYVPPESPERVLSVPRYAVLETGERALVYVAEGQGAYRATEVDVGPLARDADGAEFYPVQQGLSAGEKVVTRGNFLIDSQMQLAGKPSLFQPGAFAREQEQATRETRAPTGSEATSADGKQTTCPVMVGNPIDPETYVDYKGVRVYFCCPGCDKKFLAEPDRYMPNLPATVREEIESHKTGDDVKQTICPVMGNPIVADVYVEFRGERVYFCCPPCEPKFLANPDQYIPNLPEGLQQKLRAGATTQEGQDD